MIPTIWQQSCAFTLASRQRARRHRRFAFFCFFTSGAFVLSSVAAPGQIVALFDFNDMAANNDGTTVVTVDNSAGTPTVTLLEDSGPLADLNGQGGMSFTDAEGIEHASGQSAGWTTGTLNTSTDPNDAWLLEVDTTGYQDLALRFDYRLTDAIFQDDELSGPTQLTIDWSAGGGGFNTIDTFDLIHDNEWHELLLDLTGIAQLENATDAQIRGTWSNDGSESIPGGVAPSARLDNLQLTGIPEPATIGLVAFVLVAIVIRQRR